MPEGPDVGGLPGFWLRKQREAAGLTQEELALRSGLSVRTISNLERGTGKPYPRSVRLIIGALGLTKAAGEELIAQYRANRAAGSWRASQAGGGGARSMPDRMSTGVALVPRQLPVAARHFVGRRAELELLTRIFDQRGQAAGTVAIGAITGTAGVGKTALTVHWAHQHASLFPDGQLYVDLRGYDPSGTPMQPATAVRQFLDALPVPAARIPTGLDAQIGLYRSLLADKRMLVVLDNARDSGQVRPLLPAAAGCAVLITSRTELADLIALDGAIPLAANLLTTDEARQLLASRLGPARVSRERQAADEIAGLCARLPLALNIATSRATTRPATPLSSLAAELRDTRLRLDLLSAGTGAANLRAVFSWSYQAVSPPASSMFCLLGLHPGPDISVAAAASLAAMGPGQTCRALSELTTAHLLTEQIPGRYSLHDLLRAYAAEQAETAGSREDCHAAIGRMLDHYLHTARAATLLLYPARDLGAISPPRPGVVPEQLIDDKRALDWFDGERLVLLAVTALAAKARFDCHAWQMSSVLAAYLERRGHWHDYVSTQTLALDAAEHAGDLAGQANARLLLGRASSRTCSGETAQIHLQYALELYETLGDRTGQAHAHHSLGWVLGRQCRYHEAQRHASQALSLYQAVNHRTGEARALNTVGWYGSLLGMHQQALTHCQQALELHRELGNHDGEADAWDSLGHAHHHLGRTDDAVTCYQQALSLFARLGDRHQEADTLTRLGDTYRAAGRPRQARDAWQRALRIMVGLQHPDTGTVRARLVGLTQTGADI
jgi:tetratricopeptide (TPR) repeat protein